MADGRADLGVLFVHGIGQPSRGQTLEHIADPLVRWLQLWLEDDDNSNEFDSTRESRVAIEPVVAPACSRDAAPAAPPAVQVTMYVPGGATRTLLLAESWWQGEVTAPPFRRLVAWGAPMLPWIVLDFFVAFLWRSARWANLPGILLSLLLLILAPVLAVGAVAATIVLLVLDTIPFIKSRVRQVTLGAAGSVGDSYLLLNNPFQRTAMVSRILNDLEWLSVHCNRIAIVGHSQGAVLSHLICKRYLRERPHIGRRTVLLVTFGSAVWRLRSLIALRRRRFEQVVVGLLGIGAAVLLAVAGWRHGVDSMRLVGSLAFNGRAARDIEHALRGLDPFEVVFGLVAGIYLVQIFLTTFVMAVRSSRLLLWLTVVICIAIPTSPVLELLVSGAHTLISRLSGIPNDAHIATQLRELADAMPYLGAAALCLFPVVAVLALSARRDALSNQLRLPDDLQIQWNDYTASSDPVSNGLSASIDPRAAGIRNQTVVHNRRAMLLDHSAYVANIDGFVTLLAIDLLKAARVPLSFPSSNRAALSDSLRERVRLRREYSTMVLMVGRWAVLAAGLFMTLGLGNLATKSSGECKGKSVVCNVGARVPEQLTAIAPGGSDWTFHFGTGTIEANDVWGLLVVLACVGMSLGMTTLIWNFWQRAALRMAVRLPPTPDGSELWWIVPASSYIGAVVVVVAGMLGVGFGAFRFGNAMEASRTIGIATGCGLAVAVVSAFICLMSASEKPRSTQSSPSDESWKAFRLFGARVTPSEGSGGGSTE